MSKVIHNPALEKVVKNSDTNFTIVLSPIHKGYGNTLGNSLRRVLLSSIKGGAIVSAKFTGATHEFTTLKGVKEDVLDIVLNLKNVHLIVHSDEPVEVSIKKSGAGQVTAADIKTTADVEVVNPNQIIATIDDPKAKFEASLVVESGRGYRSIEESSEKQLHSDMIAMDAVFSPVRRVRYKVADTRVGDNANLEKIELTIETDGSITPAEAFEEAAAILANQYRALAGTTMVDAGPSAGSEGDDANSELTTSIEDLGLSARTANALVNNDIKTVGDLINLDDQDLRELKGFGSKALEEVKEKLAELEI